MQTREIIDAITALAQVLTASGMSLPSGPQAWTKSSDLLWETTNLKIIELIKLLPNGSGN